jgi:putative transposase
MAKEFEWAGKLNSMARQASAERAIFAIQRFFGNCFRQETRKKGIPAVARNTLVRSNTKRQDGYFLLTKDV